MLGCHRLGLVSRYRWMSINRSFSTKSFSKRHNVKTPTDHRSVSEEVLSSPANKKSTISNRQQFRQTLVPKSVIQNINEQKLGFPSNSVGKPNPRLRGIPQITLTKQEELEGQVTAVPTKI